MSEPLPGFAASLRREAAARGLELAAGPAEALALHCRLLLRWNRAVRLTAITDEAGLRDRHVLESLEALPFLPPGPGRLVDVGSGNGFPALPLLLLRADLAGELLEPAVRKRAFLKEAVRRTGLAVRVGVRPDRVETAGGLEALGPFRCLTARAVGSLEVILEGAARGLSPGGRALLFVGRAGADRLRERLPAGLEGPELHRLRGRRASFLAVLSRPEAC